MGTFKFVLESLLRSFVDLSKVAQVKGVIQVDSVYGRFDAIVTVEAANLEKLGDLVYRVIEKVPNVIHTETALALSRTKE